jgi:ABC-type transport system substrate-binding protein
LIAKVPQEIVDELSKTGRFTYTEYSLPQYSAVFFNEDNKLLRSTKLRKALSESIDRAGLIKQLKGKIFLDSLFVGIDNADLGIKYNFQEAITSLTEMGYGKSKDPNIKYLVDAKGAVLSLGLTMRSYVDGTPQQAEALLIANYFVSEWAKLGVEVKVSWLDAENFAASIQNKSYDMIFTGQSLGYNLDTYSFWHSSQAAAQGLNLSNLRVFEIDALIEKIRDSVNMTENRKLAASLATKISAQMPALFLYRPSYVLANDGKVSGVNMRGLAFPADRFEYINEWCVHCQ